MRGSDVRQSTQEELTQIFLVVLAGKKSTGAIWMFPNERGQNHDSVPLDPTDKMLCLSQSDEEPPELGSDDHLKPEEYVDGYIVRRKLGQGGFGQVYLVYDSCLQREVAIKVFKSGQSESVAGALWEGRAYGKVSNVHVVKPNKYGVLAERSLAYLEFDFFEGGTLAEYVRSDDRSVDRTVQLMEKIADAVAAIHDANLAHRDLKPANVLLDRNGNPFVADFGLAVALDALSDSKQQVAGTGPYMAPEQFRVERSKLDSRVDIWALGVILYEMLTGTRPFEDSEAILAGDYRPPSEIDNGVSVELERIVGRCLALSKDDRYESAAELRDSLKRLKGSRDGSPSVELGPNPYRGLSCFTEEDARLFFGRSGHVNKILTKLHELYENREGQTPRVLPILGPSGCGKSSIVRAGVVSRIRPQPFRGCRGVQVAIMTPGFHPLEQIARELARRASPDDPSPVAKSEEFLQVLKENLEHGDGQALRRIVDSLPGIAESPLVLVIDQFEELYTNCLSSDHDANTMRRKGIADLILAAASDRSGHLNVILTLRSDFLPDTHEHRELSNVLAANGILIPTMSQAELRSAISEPAAYAGYQYDSAFIDLLVQEGEEREGSLPLLEFALTRVWEGLTDGTPPAETLRSIGGVGGALAGEAQRIYDGMSKRDRGIAKRIFLGLVQLGEGSRDTRRRVPVNKLRSHLDDPEEFRTVLNRFSASGSHRLITLSADSNDSVEWAEVTHETLFENWQQLRDWLDESRERIRFLRRLEEAAQHWKSSERPNGLLWRSPDLGILRRTYNESREDFNQLQVEFLEASLSFSRKQKSVPLFATGMLLLVLAIAAPLIGTALKNQRKLSLREDVEDLLGADNWSDELPALGELLDKIDNDDYRRGIRESLEQRLQSEQEELMGSDDESRKKNFSELLKDFRNVFPESIVSNELEIGYVNLLTNPVELDMSRRGRKPHHSTSYQVFDKVIESANIEVDCLLKFDDLDASAGIALIEEKKIGEGEVREGESLRSFELLLDSTHTGKLLITLLIDGLVAKQRVVERSSELKIRFRRNSNRVDINLGDNVVISHYELMTDNFADYWVGVLDTEGIEYRDFKTTYSPRLSPDGSTLKPSQADIADHQFLEGDYLEASVAYRVLEQRAVSEDARMQYRLKEAICQTHMPGDDERMQAVATLEEIALSPSNRWSTIATYELLRSDAEWGNLEMTLRVANYITAPSIEDRRLYAPKELWPALEDRIEREGTVSHLLRRTANDLVILGSWADLARYAPVTMGHNIRNQVATAYHYADEENEALKRVNEILDDSSAQAITDLSTLVSCLETATWIAIQTDNELEMRRCQSRIKRFLEENIDRINSQWPGYGWSLHLKTARLKLALGEDQEGARTLLNRIGYQSGSSSVAAEALLLLGFELEDEDPEAALKAWKEGFRIGKRLRGGLGDAHIIMLGSLSGELTEEDVATSFNASLSQQLNEYPAAEILLRFITGGVFDEVKTAMVVMYRDYPGKEFAERVARRETSPAKFLTTQGTLGSYHTIRIGAFGGSFTDDQSKLIWDFFETGMRLWREREVSELDLGPMLMCYFPLTTEISFSSTPDGLREEMAYLLAHRFWDNERLREKYLSIAEESTNELLRELTVQDRQTLADASVD